LNKWDALVTSAKSNGRGEAGRPSVGFYTSQSAGNLRAALVDFRQRCPHVALGMVERLRMRLVTALHNGAIDVVIATDGGYVFDSNALTLWSERIFLALPEGIRWHRRKRSTGPTCGMRRFSVSTVRGENLRISC
jgi:hypothetical protein